HLGLIVASVVALLVARGRLRCPSLAWFATSLVAGYLLLAGYLRWQPWESRLQLPLFVLASAVVGVVAARSLRGRWLALAGAGLVVASLSWLLLDNTRPLLLRGNVWQTDRITQYFAGRPALERPYRQAADEVRRASCRHVGLVIGGDDWEYPVWV